MLGAQGNTNGKKDTVCSKCFRVSKQTAPLRKRFNREVVRRQLEFQISKRGSVLILVRSNDINKIKSTYPTARSKSIGCHKNISQTRLDLLIIFSFFLGF